MKKNIYKIAIVAVIAAITGIGVYQVRQANIEMSDLAMSNVEALANNENEEFESPNGQAYSFKCGVKTGIFQTCQSTIVTCQSGGKGCNPRKCPVHG